MTAYDTIMELIQTRRSVRRYSPKAVGREQIERVLEAARWAPSNHNRQGWKFLVCRNPRTLERLAQNVTAALKEKTAHLEKDLFQKGEEFIHHATLFGEAPCVILVLHKHPTTASLELLGNHPTPELVAGEPLSAAMAVQNLLLAAHSLGLGACVMTAPLIALDALIRSFDPPPGYDMTCLVTLGYPNEVPPAPPRKTLEKISEFPGDRK